MKIRQLTKDDSTILRSVWAEGLRLQPAAFLLSVAELDAIPEEQFVKGFSAGLTFGAFENDALQGFVVARRSPFERLRHTADIGPIYVTQAAQGRGIGRALLVAVLDQLIADGTAQVELTVDAQNAAAIGLYQSLGFTTFGTRPRSVVIDGVARTDHLMIKILDGSKVDGFKA